MWGEKSENRVDLSSIMWIFDHTVRQGYNAVKLEMYHFVQENDLV